MADFAPLPAVAAWRLLEAHEGFEVAHLTPGVDAIRFSGTSVGVEDGVPWSFRYNLEIGADWRARRGSIRSADGGRLALESDGPGRWLVDGVHDPALDGVPGHRPRGLRAHQHRARAPPGSRRRGGSRRAGGLRPHQHAGRRASRPDLSPGGGRRRLRLRVRLTPVRLPRVPGLRRRRAGRGLPRDRPPGPARRRRSRTTQARYQGEADQDRGDGHHAHRVRRGRRPDAHPVGHQAGEQGADRLSGL